MDETHEVMPTNKVSRRRALAMMGGLFAGLAGSQYLKTGETSTMTESQLRGEILAKRLNKTDLRAANNGFIEYLSETLPPSNTRAEVMIDGHTYVLDQYRVSYGTTYYDTQGGFVDSVKPVVVETKVPNHDQSNWRSFRKRCFEKYSQMPKTQFFDQSFATSFYFKSQDEDKWIIVSYHLFAGTQLDRGLSANVTDLRNLTMSERFQIAEAYGPDAVPAQLGSNPIIRETYRTMSDGTVQVDQAYNERHANTSQDYAAFIAASMPRLADRRSRLAHDFADAPHKISVINDTHEEARG